MGRIKSSISSLRPRGKAEVVFPVRGAAATSPNKQYFLYRAVPHRLNEAAPPQRADKIPLWGGLTPGEQSPARCPGPAGMELGCSLAGRCHPRSSLIKPWPGSPLPLTSRRRKSSQVLSKERRKCHLLTGSNAKWLPLPAFCDLSHCRGCSG